MAILDVHADVWSKRGTEAYFSALSALRDLNDLLGEIEPFVKRLKRRAAALDSAAVELGDCSYVGAARLLRGTARGASGVVGAFEASRQQAGDAFRTYAPRNRRDAEHPSDLVAALESEAERCRALRHLLTPRGLAIYEIATERDGPCNADRFAARENRWKRNRQVAHRERGTRKVAT
jgi:hypothetical protein